MPSGPVSQPQPKNPQEGLLAGSSSHFGAKNYFVALGRCHHASLGSATFAGVVAGHFDVGAGHEDVETGDRNLVV